FIGLSAKELRAVDDRSQDRLEIAVCALPGLHTLVHKRFRGIVGNKTPAEFGGDKAHGGGVAGEHVEDGLAVLHLTARRDHSAQNGLFTAVMEVRVELKLPAVAPSAYSPAGQAASHLGDILLSVAAIDSQRMQLQKLAR